MPPLRYKMFASKLVESNNLQERVYCSNIAAIAIIMKSRSCGDRCSSNCCHEAGCQSIASLVDAHVYSQKCTKYCVREKQHLCTHTFITLSASSQCSSSVCCAISLAPAYTLQLQQKFCSNGGSTVRVYSAMY